MHIWAWNLELCCRTVFTSLPYVCNVKVYIYFFFATCSSWWVRYAVGSVLVKKLIFEIVLCALWCLSYAIHCWDFMFPALYFMQIILTVFCASFFNRVLIGTGRVCIETLRPLAYSLLAEMVHYVRSELSLAQVSLSIILFTTKFLKLFWRMIM